MKFGSIDLSRGEGEALNLGWKHMFCALWQELFPLIKANLCFLLFCLPVATIPAAFCAMHGVCMELIRGNRVAIFRAFRKAIKETFFSAWAIFLLEIAVVAIAVMGAKVYFMERPWGWISAFPGLLLSSIAVVCLLALPYALTMLARMKLSLRQILKNAFLLVFLNAKFSICGGVIAVALIAVQILYWLYAIPVILLIGPALVFYFSTYFALYGLQRFVLTEPL